MLPEMGDKRDAVLMFQRISSYSPIETERTEATTFTRVWRSIVIEPTQRL